MLDFLKSDTFRRIVAGIVGVALPFINSKFGLNIPQEQVISAIGLAAVYIGQSTVNAMHARSVESKTVTVEQAAAVLAAAAGAKPVVP